MTTPHYTASNGRDTLDYLNEQFTEQEFMGFIKGNIIKYASRLGKKDAPIQELKKIIDYCERAIKFMEEENHVENDK